MPIILSHKVISIPWPIKVHKPIAKIGQKFMVNYTDGPEAVKIVGQHYEEDYSSWTFDAELLNGKTPSRIIELEEDLFTGEDYEGFITTLP